MKIAIFSFMLIILGCLNSKAQCPNAGIDFSVCGKFAYVCATPCTGFTNGQWHAPGSGIAYYDALNGTYTPSNQYLPCTWIRYSGMNDTVNMVWSEFNGSIYLYDTVKIYFASIQPAISLVDPADSMVCGTVYTLLSAQYPAYGYGYWIDGDSLTAFTPNPLTPSPIATVNTNNYGDHNYYWVTVNGLCRDTSDAVHVNFIEYPIANAGPDTSILGLTTAFSGVWDSIGVGQWNCINSIYSYVFDVHSPMSNVEVYTAGTYIFVWQVNNFGCFDSDTVQITFNNVSSNYSEDFEYNIKFYPNPANNNINISIGNYSEEVNIQINDKLGNENIKQIISPNKQSIELNIQNLNSGIYFIKLTDKNGNILGTEKFMKEYK
ncbi:MAG: T9SS type A sorting domain-containing protein [Bacteroidia bacterium]|nr:T9SS type A sorting domain-containing protein [Bacteroidia bacterium]